MTSTPETIEKAPVPSTANGAFQIIQKRKFSSKSTATEAQIERIAAMLSAGPKSTIELRRAGIMQPAARIKTMNDDKGFYISSNPINVVDDWGYMHCRVALYELIDRPKV